MTSSYWKTYGQQYRREHARRYAIGKAILDKLEPRLPATTVGKMLGLGHDRILQIERMAVYKIIQALHEIRQEHKS